MARYGVRFRRVYEETLPDDGARVLVDRVWPRGLRKQDAQLHEWCKNVAPSTELRKWYAHDPAKFDRFRESYRRELDRGEAAEALRDLRELAETQPVTLLTATRDAEHSHARVLAELL